MESSNSASLLHRVAAFDSAEATIFVDDVAVPSRLGETVLAAVLCHGAQVRRHEIDDTPRAGFCLMGACQDCWVWIDSDRRGRACTTLVEEGMRISTRALP